MTSPASLRSVDPDFPTWLKVIKKSYFCIEIKNNDAMMKDGVLYDNYDCEEYDEFGLRDVLDELREIPARAWIAGGMVERWTGRRKGLRLFDTFDEMFNSITQDCDFVKIEILKGKLIITASHHDGTNCLECKVVTDRGYQVYDNWNFGVNTSLGDLGEYQVLEIVWKSNLFSKRATR